MKLISKKMISTKGNMFIHQYKKPSAILYSFEVAEDDYLFVVEDMGLEGEKSVTNFINERRALEFLYDLNVVSIAELHDTKIRFAIIIGHTVSSPYNDGYFIYRGENNFVYLGHKFEDVEKWAFLQRLKK